MGKAFQFGGKIAVLAVMLALLSGCGLVVDVARTTVSATVGLATDAVETGAGLIAAPFEDDEEDE